jgi:hypothetical protein
MHFAKDVFYPKSNILDYTRDINRSYNIPLLRIGFIGKRAFEEKGEE